MLKQAKASLEKLDGRFRLLTGSFESLPDLEPSGFDAVLSIGNTLPHVRSEGDLIRGLEKIAALLRKGGVLIVHLLNYSRVLKEGNRIVGITRNDDRTFVRFYDFLDKMIRFNILIIDGREGGLSHELVSTELRPWQRDEIASALEWCGYSPPDYYGDMERREFSPDRSGNLIIEAVLENTE